ncbi:hypothetical protein LOK49_LG06G03243 [Camellia lanceoleosa]|uniref:Uncharacterized protein n=1 Tax=Camellia lanceoleosa TaxID=1840588 RepID=A0ACC0HFR3_9ERIC|nr:hypothetical protein LOK49_LG06G03243 [Camellia lanceoleosa]
MDGEQGEVLLELLYLGQRALLLPGGRGGRGNASFKSGTNKVPKIVEIREEGPELWLELEIKLVVDVGIIGAPNAGKSTLLSVISAAQRAIANYPFTTLLPNLGVVSFDYDSIMLVVDLPGLLEGAHRGFGLGHEFLRHTERCSALVHVVDGSSQQPEYEFDAVRLELELEATHEVICAAYELVRKRMEDNKEEGWDNPVSLNHVADMVQKQQTAPINEFEISHESSTNTWHVVGSGYIDSERRFQHVLEACSVYKSLIKLGVKEGDTVIVGEMEMVWHSMTDSRLNLRKGSTVQLNGLDGHYVTMSFKCHCANPLSQWKLDRTPYSSNSTILAMPLRNPHSQSIAQICTAKKGLYSLGMLVWVLDYALIIRNLPQATKLGTCCVMETQFGECPHT